MPVLCQTTLPRPVHAYNIISLGPPILVQLMPVLCRGDPTKGSANPQSQSSIFHAWVRAAWLTKFRRELMFSGSLRLLNLCYLPFGLSSGFVLAPTATAYIRDSIGPEIGPNARDRPITEPVLSLLLSLDSGLSRINRS